MGGIASENRQLETLQWRMAWGNIMGDIMGENQTLQRHGAKCKIVGDIVGINGNVQNCGGQWGSTKLLEMLLGKMFI